MVASIFIAGACVVSALNYLASQGGKAEDAKKRRTSKVKRSGAENPERLNDNEDQRKRIHNQRKMQEQESWRKLHESMEQELKEKEEAQRMKHYRTLGLDRTATMDDAKRSYRRLALQHHPDKHGDAEAFKEVVAAYEAIICDLGKQTLLRHFDGI